jgi:hypothetical protein
VLIWLENQGGGLMCQEVREELQIFKGFVYCLHALGLDSISRET